MAAISTLYVETEIREHPRTEKIVARHPSASIIECNRYTEVFNPKSQNFRLQKLKPALLLARKHKAWVLPTPAENHVGGENNYYFSHMLNCIYDCRYCFLQGMYRSANYVLYVNYDDFVTAIDEKIDLHRNQPVWFFSGYDCDSLAFDPVTGFVDYFLPVFAARPNAYLELRTKSTQVRSLLNTDPLPNVVVAFSFTPQNVSNKLENGVPSVHRRLQAISKLADKGWQIGLRFDPLIYHNDYQRNYDELFTQVFSAIEFDAIHSVSYGAFRLPRSFHRKMISLYPDELLFSGPLETNQSMTSYRSDLEHDLLSYCQRALSIHVDEQKLFACTVTGV